MSPESADHFTDHIVEAHLRGVETHGLRRVKPYMDRIAKNGIDPKATPEIRADGCLLSVDGRNGVGHHVGAVTADAASRTASELGVGVALIRNSNHFGFAGYYATRIATRNQIGLAISNGQVLIAPPGSRQALFSNNPLAIAAPVGSDRFMEFDMALSAISRAKIVMAAERGETIPFGLAVDSEGRDTQDPAAAVAGFMLPFGGKKGFAFLFALEVLTGVLSGGAYADQVSSKEKSPGEPERLSQFVAAIDIRRMMSGDEFQGRMRDLVRCLKNLPLREGAAELRYPGERRWRLREKRLKEGVPISNEDYKALTAMTEAYALDVEDFKQEEATS